MPLVDERDLEEGDLGIDFVEDEVGNTPCAFCFFVGESPLLKVNVLLRGRVRLDELVDLDPSAFSLESSSCEPSRDFECLLRVGRLEVVSPQRERLVSFSS